MNSNCTICDVEKECGYEYKPCDCCNYRKFKPKSPEQTKSNIQTTAQIIEFRKKPDETLPKIRI